MAGFDKDGNRMQTDQLKTFYCISTDIKQTVFALKTQANSNLALIPIQNYRTPNSNIFQNAGAFHLLKMICKGISQNL